MGLFLSSVYPDRSPSTSEPSAQPAPSSPAPSADRTPRVYPGRAELSPADRRTLRDILGPWPGPPDSPDAILYEYAFLADVRLCIIPFHPPVFGPDGAARCGCGQVGCTSDPGKHPAVKWRDVDSPTVGTSLLHAWLSRRWPGRGPNVALIMGGCEPELCAFDYDPRNGGDKSLAALVAEHGPLPETWLDETSGGGGHYFFERPARLPDTAAVVVAPGVDFLQTRHPTIIAPSVHQSGKVYRWRPGRAPWETPLAPLPQWLADLVVAKAEAAKAKTRAASLEGTTAWIPADLDRRKLVERARAYVDRMPSARTGSGGHKTTFHVCCVLVIGFALQEDEAWGLLLEYNQRCEPPWTEGELRHKLADAMRQPGQRGHLAAKGLEGSADLLACSRADLQRLGLVPDKNGHLPGLDGDEEDAGGRDDAGPDPDPSPRPTRGPTDAAAPAEPGPETGKPFEPAEPAALKIPDPRDGRAAPPDADALPSKAAVVALLAAEAAAAEAARPTGDRWAAAIAAGPGLYVDRQPEPRPAHAVRRVLSLPVVSSLTVTRSRAECAEIVDTLRTGEGSSGLRVETYPSRTRQNCQNFDEAEMADRTDLPATQSVCPDCRHLEGCPFQKALLRTREAPHRVATAARVAANAGEFEGARAAFLFGNSLDVLVPFAATRELEPRHLRPLIAAAKAAGVNARRKGTFKGQVAADWWRAFAEMAEKVYALAEAGRPTEVPTLDAGRPPQRWTATLWRQLYDGVNPPPQMPRGLIRVLVAATSGDLATLLLHAGDEVDVEEMRQGRRSGQALRCESDATGRSERPARRLAAVWHARDPGCAVVVAESIDATDLQRATGVPVVDVTGVRPPAWTDRAVQVPVRQTAGRRPGAVASTVRAHLDRHPGDRWLVVLPGRLTRARALAKEVVALLPEQDRDRVTATSWFDTRPLPEVDRVLCVGVPAVPPQRVRQWLAQTGQVAAALADGDWGLGSWEGYLADDGEVVSVDGWRYRQPEWARGYREVVRELMRQRLAPVRVPVTVLADSDLGLPLAERPGARAMDGDDRRLVDALQRLVSDAKGGQPVAGAVAPLSSTLAVNTAEVEPPSVGGEGATARLLEDMVLPSSSTLAVSKGVSTPALVEATGIPARTARRRLESLAQAGWVRRVGSRLGWALPAAATRPTRPPAVADPSAAAPGAEAVPGLGSAAGGPLSGRAAREAERAALAELLRSAAEEFNLVGVPGCPRPSAAPASTPDGAAARPPAALPPEQEDLFEPRAKRLAGEHSLRLRRDPRGNLRVAACSRRGFAVGWSRETYATLDAARAACESRAFRWLPPLVARKPEAVGPIAPANSTSPPGPQAGQGGAAAKPAGPGKKKAKPKRSKETASDLEQAARKSHRPSGMATATHGTVNGCPVFRLRTGDKAADTDPAPEGTSAPSDSRSNPPAATPPPATGGPPEAA